MRTRWRANCRTRGQKKLWARCLGASRRGWKGRIWWKMTRKKTERRKVFCGGCWVLSGRPRQTITAIITRRKNRRRSGKNGSWRRKKRCEGTWTNARGATRTPAPYWICGWQAEEVCACFFLLSPAYNNLNRQHFGWLCTERSIG